MDRKSLKELVKERTRSGGSFARHCLLAYALFRGRAYRDVELRTQENHLPSITLIAETLKVPVDQVRSWVSIPASEERVRRDHAAREEQLRKKRERSIRLREELSLGNPN